jgi:hypothetical protein
MQLCAADEMLQSGIPGGARGVGAPGDEEEEGELLVGDGLVITIL